MRDNLQQGFWTTKWVTFSLRKFCGVGQGVDSGDCWVCMKVMVLCFLLLTPLVRRADLFLSAGRTISRL
jgi:hypothetical protein